ncbi:VCBS domain-containing protein [Mycobacterium sp. B14F4]
MTTGHGVASAETDAGGSPPEPSTESATAEGGTPTSREPAEVIAGTGQSNGSQSGPAAGGNASAPETSLSASGGANTHTSEDPPADEFETVIDDEPPEPGAAIDQHDDNAENPDSSLETAMTYDAPPAADDDLTSSTGADADVARSDAPSSHIGADTSYSVNEIDYAAVGFASADPSGQMHLTATTAATEDPSATTRIVSVAALSPIEAILAVPVRIVAGLLALVGLAPAATAPGTPVSPISRILELAWIAVRRVKSFFLNNAPAPSVVVSEPDAAGVIRGTIGSDPDGDRLNFRLVTPPTQGEVTVDEETGAFSYSPGAAGTHTFRVAIQDRGFHLHGLLGFFRPDGGHSTIATVSVTVPAGPNEAPVFESSGPPAVNEITGVVTGTVKATDADNDEVTYSVTPIDSTLGTVAINADSGRWTYVPSNAARLRAAQTSAEDAVSFTVTATDGRLPTSIGLSAPITPAAATVVDSIELTEVPTEVVVTLDGTVLVTDPSTPTLTVVDSDKTVTVVDLDFNPLIVRTEDNDTAWAVSADASYRIDLDGALTSVTRIADLPSAPEDLLVVRGSDYVLTTGSDGKLTFTDRTTGTQTTVELDGERVRRVAVVTETTTRTEIAGTTESGISRLAVFTDLGSARTMTTTAPGVAVGVTQTIDLGGRPTAITTSADRLYVTVTNEQGADRLVVIDTSGGETGEADWSVMGSVEVGRGAVGVAVDHDGVRGYVANKADGTVSVVELATREIVETVYTGSATSVGVSLDGRAFVADPSASAIRVIGDDFPTVVGEPGFTIDGQDLDGRVFGFINVTDADDSVTFLIDSGAGEFGTVTVDSVTGKWTFTPSAEARQGTVREVAFDIAAQVNDSFYTVEVIAPIIPFPQPAQCFILADVTDVGAPGTDASVRLIDLGGVHQASAG